MVDDHNRTGLLTVPLRKGLDIWGSSKNAETENVESLEELITAIPVCFSTSLDGNPKKRHGYEIR